MKRKVILLAALAMFSISTALAYNPYAPNPFDGLEKNSWQYAYIMDLTKAGLTGESMAKFAPSYTLTRVELREMLVRAYENRHRADAKQKKEIDRLVEEYRDDLQYAKNGSKVTTESEEKGITFDWRGETKYHETDETH